MAEHCATHQAKGPNASCYAYCGCRCRGCREAKRLRDVQWRAVRRHLYPQGSDKVDAAKAKQALERVHKAGYSDRQLADAARLSQRRVWEIRTGKHPTILRRTGRRVVSAVRRLERDEPPARPDGMVVRAMLVWLRDRGAPDHWLAHQLHTHAAHVWQLRTGRYQQPTRPTADRVRRLRDDVLAGRAVPPGHANNARLEERAGR